jgi:antagonist of KipI
MSLLVLDPGPMTTVQDLGRPGFGAFGVAPSGAMDPWALRTANVLVGNHENTAGLEFTLRGPTLAFETDATLALTGSAFESALLRSVPGSAFERDVEPEPVPHLETFRARAGETLRIGKTREGARGYLAVAGGITIDAVLGSCSTQVAAGLGGRVLRSGDRFETGRASDVLPRSASHLETSHDENVVRAIAGPQADLFTARALERFFGERYRVRTHADRTGVRLDGPALELAGPPDIDPEGVVSGAVQVAADEQPIVLCADRPASGGYAKIATVIGADLFVFAYAKPGDVIRFQATTPEDARAAWREREQSWRKSIEDAR